MQTLSVSKLTTKNQATIPDRVCKKLGLKPGDSVAFKFKDDHIYLKKLALSTAHSLAPSKTR